MNIFKVFLLLNLIISSAFAAPLMGTTSFMYNTTSQAQDFTWNKIQTESNIFLKMDVPCAFLCQEPVVKCQNYSSF